LSGYTNNNEISFVCIEPKSIVYHLTRDITETVTQPCKSIGERWKTKELPSKNSFLFYLIEIYLLRMSGSRWELCPICHISQRCDLEEQWCQKLQINLLLLMLYVTFPISMFTGHTNLNVNVIQPFSKVQAHTIANIDK